MVHSNTNLDYDAIVIGAGISGLYQLYRLRELGLTVRVFERGTGVGGHLVLESIPRCPVRFGKLLLRLFLFAGTSRRVGLVRTLRITA